MILCSKVFLLPADRSRISRLTSKTRDIFSKLLRIALLKGIKKISAGIKLGLMKRRYQPGSISLPADILNVSSVLVCLPPGQRELTMIKQFLPDISRIFGHADIYLLASPGSSVYDIFPRKGYRIMTPSSGDISWDGLASKKYLELLKKNNYDLILDLNLKPNYFVQSILLSFPNAVKIGKSNNLGMPYYNIEIKTKYIRDEKNIYKSMIKTIESLKSKAAANAEAP